DGAREGGRVGEVPALARVVLAAPHGGQPQLLGQDRLLEALGVEARVGLASIAWPQLGPDPEGRWSGHAQTLPNHAGSRPPPRPSAEPPAPPGRMPGDRRAPIEGRAWRWPGPGGRLRSG